MNYIEFTNVRKKLLNPNRFDQPVAKIIPQYSDEHKICAVADKNIGYNIILLIVLNF